MPVPDLQQAYSIDVKNRYNIGYDESDDETEEVQDLDPFDQLQKIEEEKERERELKKLSKTKPAVAAKKSQKKEPRTALTKKDNEGQDKNSKPNQDRRRPYQGDRQYQKGNDENRRPPRRRFDNNRRGGYRGDGERENSEQAPVLEGVAKPEGNPERSERYRGSRGGRGGGRGYGGRGGRREFDRRSGNARSGVRAGPDKRDGGGSRNWGTPGKEIDDATQEKSDEFGSWAENEAGNAEGAEKKEETPAADGEDRVAPEAEKDEELPEPEPEEIEITYDEWKAAQEKKDKPEFNIRKPGEGEDGDRWGGVKVVSKKSEEVKAVSNATESHKRQDRPKHVDMDIRFRSEQGRGGGGRGRGGRGRGGRGRGGRGGPRSEYSSHENKVRAAPDVMNESEFPTLA